MDEHEALVDLLGKRAAAGIVPKPRTAPLATDLYGLGFALRPFISSPTVDVSGYRREGRVAADGSGYVVDASPFGGSVIEGYHYRLRAVLASGAVLLAEERDDGPPGPTELHGESPELDTVVSHANQDARVRIDADHTVWPALRYGILAILRERVGWPALEKGQAETLTIALDGDGTTVRFTYKRDRTPPWSGTAALDATRELHFDGS
jgi:hypothetical protein